MQIFECYFTINHPTIKGGLVEGCLIDGKIQFRGTRNVPTEKQRWKGSGFFAKEEILYYETLIKKSFKDKTDINFVF